MTYSDHPSDTVEVYRSKADGQWRWRYKAGGNGRILADSGEGYVQKAQCIKMVCRILGYRYTPGMVGFTITAGYLNSRERNVKMEVIE